MLVEFLFDVLRTGSLVWVWLWAYCLWLRLGVGLRLRFGVCGTSCLSVLFGFDFVFDCVWLILLVIVNSVG